MKVDFMVGIGSETLVGVLDRPFPIKHGNCFSAETKKGKSYRIINFNVENIREVMRRGVTMPIRIQPLSKRTALLHDARIPAEWYMTEYCRVCCPDSLQLQPKLLQDVRDRECGYRKDTFVEKENFTVVSFDVKKRPKLKDI